MQIKFYERFMKQADSFKVPGSDYPALLQPTYDGEIKGDFSPLAPVVRFRTIPATSMPTYTYCYIDHFKRYYFCSWAFVSGFWECSMTCDVLGSFKDQILASRQFVKRSAHEKTATIADANYMPHGIVGQEIRYVQQPDLWGANFYNGTVVVSIVNSTAYNIGANTYYAMSYLGFQALMYALLNSPNWMNIDAGEISENLQKALINPAQYITGAVWLPIPSSQFVNGSDVPSADVVQVVKLGWWEFNLQTPCRILHAPTGQYDSWMRQCVFTFSDHPQASVFGAWVNRAPFTRRILDFAPFGCIEIDPTELQGTNQITCRVFVQAYSGEATLYIYAGTYDAANPNNARLITSLTGTVGVPLPTGQIRIDTSNFKNAIFGGVAVGALDYLEGQGF